MAWIAEQLLKIIDRHALDECITFDQLIWLSRLKPKQVENATYKLRKHGLITLTEPGCYRITSEGRQALADEDTNLRSGPHGSSQKERIHKKSLRTRIWRAIRIRKKFSLPELEPLVCTGHERDMRNNAGKYLKALESAGYLIKMKKVEAGTAPTSNGFARWWLPDDKNTGPIAPIWRPGKGVIFDPNIGEEVLCGEKSC